MEALSKALFCHALVAGASPTELMVPAFALVKGYCSRVAMLACILLIITWRLGR